jgi:hypothetical protein
MAYTIKSIKTRAEPKSISQKYWTIERDEKGDYHFSLGNLTDAGWYWSGHTDEAIGFMRRIDKSKVKDQFLVEAKKEGITFESLKPTLLKSARVSNGLYMLSGDNVRWHFGEGVEYEEGILEDENLTEEQKDKFWGVYRRIDYDDFEKQNKKWYKAEITKAINESNTYEQFFEKMNDIAGDLEDVYREKVINETYEALPKQEMK